MPFDATLIDAGDDALYADADAYAMPLLLPLIILIISPDAAAARYLLAFIFFATASDMLLLERHACSSAIFCHLRHFERDCHDAPCLRCRWFRYSFTTLHYFR